VNDELIALEEGLADAIRRSDAEAASRFLAEDFVLSSTGGVSPHMPRGDWLAALAQLETRSLAPEVVDSRSFGDVTVALRGHRRLPTRGRRAAARLADLGAASR
jgi:Domain of unknown function (DUF4440)